MTSFTKVGQNDLDNILSLYSIDKISNYNILEGGSENTNLLLNGESKKYVLTICEQKSATEAKILGDLLRYLELNGFKTSRIISSSAGGSMSIWNNKPIVIKEYLEGYIDKNPSEAIIKKIVFSLCQLHQIESPDYVPRQFSYGIQCFDGIRSLASDSEFCPWLIDKKEYILSFLDPSLPKCLIHGDIYFSNVIVNDQNGEITIMDFEEACHYYRVFDIGMLIIGTCCDGLIPNQSKIIALISTYHLLNPLTPQEIQSTKAFTIYAACATAFWRYRQFNHLNPLPELFDHYKDLQNLADDLHDLPDSIFTNI